MAPVQTTQTLIDAQAAHKELQARHTALKATYEVDERKHKETLRATEELRTEQEHVRVEIAEEAAAAAKQLSETGELVAGAVKFLGEIGGAADRHLGVVASLQAIIGRLLEGVERARADREAHHEAMMAEERGINAKKRDLDIYEKRLADRIAAAGLQDEIKIL